MDDKRKDEEKMMNTLARKSSPKYPKRNSIKESFDKAVKLNGKALEKLSKN